MGPELSPGADAVPGGWKLAAQAPSGERALGAPEVRARSAAAGAAGEDEVAASSAFEATPARRTLDDLVVTADLRARIDHGIAAVVHHELVFDTWGLGEVHPGGQGAALNLYGPSGTGKSLCAEAIAHAIGRPMIRVNYAEIESRYVGQTPKNIVRCFAAARAADAVLVFEEGDSILGSRLSHVTQSADHAVNVARAVMLSQLDDFEGLVVFTTNFAQNYDAAFVRRILAHVRFEMPDVPTLTRLWARLLPAKLPRAAEVDPAVLAEESRGLAGGDLVNAVVAAALTAARRDGAGGCVTLADLRKALAQLRQARAEVGKSPLGALDGWTVTNDPDGAGERS